MSYLVLAMSPYEKLQDDGYGEVFEHAVVHWSVSLVQRLYNWRALLGDLMQRHGEMRSLQHIDFSQEDWQNIRVLAMQGRDTEDEDTPDYDVALTKRFGQTFADNLATGGYEFLNDKDAAELPPKLDHKLYRATWRWRPSPVHGLYSLDSTVQLITILGTELNNGDDDLFSRRLPLAEILGFVDLADKSAIPGRLGDVNAELPVRRLDRRKTNVKSLRSGGARRGGEQ